jgi:cytochrome c peroxidase
MGTCTTCHDTPNIGNHSLPVPLDIGTSHDASQDADSQIADALAQLSVADLPIYKRTCIDPASPDVGKVFYTSDPGKALIPKNGVAACTDINRIKGPILRGLSARAPYFHNGAAADLNQVVNFYNQRFHMGLSDDQKAQLVAFLQSL